MEKLLFYVKSGGPVMYLLIGMSFWGISIIISKYLLIRFEKKKLSKNAKDIFSTLINFDLTNKDMVIEMIKDRIYKFTLRMQKGLTTVKIIASISPLLGLLGTVIGVLGAFQSIAQTGLDKPDLFAGGISMALLTTVGGIIVAIPNFVFYNYLNDKMTDYEVELEEKVVEIFLTAGAEV